MKASGSGQSAILQRSVAATAVASCFAYTHGLGPAHANPTGPVVKSGTVNFQQSGRVLQITNSPNAVIHWQGFSIDRGELTRFIQQNPQSAVLNRVTGASPSAILGALHSNGRVFLINPNGILFGAGAQVNVAGMVASSLNLTDADFLAGRMRFGPTPGAGSVVNDGAITTPAGGQVYLIAPNVQNSGVITTPKGEVILAAGATVEMADTKTPLLRVEVVAPANEAVNAGKIIAEGGRVSVYGTAIRNSGTISANSLVRGENGEILLRAKKDVTLTKESVITASGPSAGKISIEAETGAAQIAGRIEANATATSPPAALNFPPPQGEGQGGGGAARGGTIDIRAQREITVDAQAVIAANGPGGGGTVTLNSASGTTRIAGAIEAKALETSPPAQISSPPPQGAGQGGGGVATGPGGALAVTADKLSVPGSLKADGASGGQVTIQANSIAQSGTITADATTGKGGTVDLRAVESVVQDAGAVVSASSIGGDGGAITIAAGSAGKVVTSAALTVTGGGIGGAITVTAKEVELRESTVDASGDAGGGLIRLGGDYQGKGTIPNSRTLYVDRHTRIRANARRQGDGGRVILWSDEHTRFLGEISARGGPVGGNGGFVETSGKNLLTAEGSVDASASRGNGGLWLLDPFNTTISNNTSTNVTVSPTFNANGRPANVQASAIVTALNGGTSVTVTTGSTGGETGNITIFGTADTGGAVNINKTSGGTATLTLQAAGSIFMNAGAQIQSTSGGGILNVTLNSGNDNGTATGSGAIFISSGAAIRSNGGNILLGGGVGASGAAIGTSTNVVGVQISGGTLAAAGGNITLRGQGFSGGSSNHGVQVTGTSNVTTTGSGSITINGQGGGTSGVSFTRGALIDTNSLVSVQNGTLGITGTGASGTGGQNEGVRLANSATLRSTGSGNIVINGTAGSSGSDNTGVFLQISTIELQGAGGLTITGTRGGGSTRNVGIRLNASTISSGLAGTGAIQLIAPAGGGSTGNDNHGIHFTGGSSIQSQNTSGGSTITLDGTGGAGGGTGINLSGSVQITSASGAIDMTGTGGTGSGTSSNKGVWLSSGALIQAAGAGGITITGNRGSGADHNTGITIDNATIRSTATGTGAIQLTAPGVGTITGVTNDGIALLSGAVIESLNTTGGSTITLTGTGGAGPNGDNFGVSAEGTGTRISTVSGAITITGTGGAGGGAGNHGIELGDGALVQTSGTGGITLTGNRGNGTGGFHRGIEIGNATIRSTASGTGAIQLNAGGGGTVGGTDNVGVLLEGGGVIESLNPTGGSTVTLNGTAGAGTDFNIGVKVADSGTRVSSASGAIAITGTGAGGAVGIELARTVNAVSSTGTGNVTLTADDMNIASGIAAGANTVTLRPLTLSRNIGIENASSGGLSLTPTELAFVTAGTLEIGRNDGTGTLAISTPVTSAIINAGVLRLFGNDIDVNTNIGGSGSEFAHSLELRARNNANVMLGSIFLANDRSLTLRADNDSSGAGQVNIGGVNLRVGTSSANTAAGSMSIQGHDILMQATAGGGSAVVTGAGAQTFTATDSITFESVSGTGGIFVNTESGPQTFTTSIGSMRILGGSAANSAASVSTNSGSQSLTLGGGFTIQAGTGTGAVANLISVNSQTISAKFIEVIGQGGNAGNLALNGGATGDQSITTTGMNASGEGIVVKNLGTAVFTQIGNFGSGAQLITVNNADRVRITGETEAASISSPNGNQTLLIRGTGLNALEVGSATALGSSTLSGRNQSVTAGRPGIDANGAITLTGGVTDARASSISGSGATQQVVTAGDIMAVGGTAVGPTGADASINHSGTGLQSISARAIQLLGGNGTGTSNSGLINAGNTSGTGGQTVTARNIEITGRAGGHAFITSNHTVGAQAITTSGQNASGEGIAIRSFAQASTFSTGIFNSGTLSTGQTITVNNAGTVVVAGVGGNAGIDSNGAQTLKIVGSGQNRLEVGAAGATGSSFVNASGTQIVNAGTSTQPGSIVITGGAGENLSARIIQDGTFTANQTVTTTGLIDIRGGTAPGTLTPGIPPATGTTTGGSFGQIRNQSTTGSQTIEANGIVLNGGTANMNNQASIRAEADQTVTVGSGGITVIGGSGEVGNHATIRTFGPNGTQTINIGNNGTIYARGGSSTNADEGSPGSDGAIRSDGVQQIINFGSNGTLTVDGGSIGAGNKGDIIATAGTQTITGKPVVFLKGGPSGGGVGSNSNGARIVNQAATGVQNLTLGPVTLTGADGGNGNAASITAPNQTIDVTGDLILFGGTGTLDLGGARIGGYRNSTNPSQDTDTNLTLTVSGSTTLTGGAISGASIGSSRDSVGKTNVITLTSGGDITLSPMTSDQVRIGSPSDDIQAGTLVITSTGGNIALNSAGGLGTTIRTLGNVTLAATGAGKSITAGAESFVQANTLAASAGGNITLGGNNQVGSLFVTTGGGNVTFTNTQALALGNGWLNTPAGSVQAVSITTTGATSDITLSGTTTTNDNVTMTSGRDFLFAGANVTANSLALNSTGSGSALFNTGTTTLTTPVTSNVALSVGGGTLNLNGATASSAPSLTVTSGTVNINDGSLSTTGSVTNSGTINLKGTGDNINLNVGGSLTLNPTSNLGIELDGLAGSPPPGTPNGNFGAIAVAGALNLDGTLTLNTGNGFTPSPGDRFDFITHRGSSTGDFEAVVNNTGFTFNFTHGGTTLRTTAGNPIDRWIFAGSGLWTDGTKWSRGVVPDSTMDVVIPDVLGAGVDVTIEISSGNNLARSLTSSENLSITGGSLTLANASTNTGLLGVSGSGALIVSGGLTGSGTISISGGTATINSPSSQASLDLSGGTVTNTATAVLSVGTLTMSAGTLNGAGNVNVTSAYNRTGGTFSIGGNASINQTSGNLTLAHQITAGGLTLNTSPGGGTISINSTVSLGGGNLVIVPASGATLSGATISSATIMNPSGLGLTLAANSTMSNVTLDANLAVPGGMSVGTSGTINVASGRAITLQGNADGAQLSAIGNTTLNGPGAIVFAGTTSNNTITTPFGGLSLTLGGGLTVGGAASTRGGSVGSVNFTTFTNSVLIDAVTAGQTITVEQVTNQAGGVLRASGGTLSLAGTSSNPAGTVAVQGGVLNLGGSFSTLGTFTRAGPGTAGTVNITGTWTNTGVFALNGNTGTFNLAGGTINGGGTLQQSGTGALVLTASSGLGSQTLDVNLAVPGGMTVGTSGTINVASGRAITLQGNADGAQLSAIGNTTLNGPGAIVFAGTTSNNTITTPFGGLSLTLGGGLTVGGAASTRGGSVGSVNFTTFTNSALIDAVTAGQTITVAGGTVINNGTLRASGGGDMTVATNSGNLTNNGTIQGVGTINLGTGTLTNASGGMLRPGASPGLTTVTGDLVLASGSVTEIEISGHARGTNPGYDAINVIGTATVNSGAQFTIQHLSGFPTNDGDSFRVINASTLSYGGGAVINLPGGDGPYVAGAQGQDFFLQRGTTFGGVNTWTNLAGGNWNVEGNWSLGIPVAGQTVLIDVTTNPTITVSDAGRVAGQLQNAETLTISAGSLTLDGNSTSSGVINISGSGTLSVASTGSLSASTLNLSESGTLGGTGTVTLSGAGTWTGNAAMGGSGRTVLQSGASLALSDGSTKFLSGGRVIDNAGTFTLSGNHALRIDTGGATFNNSGTFTFTDNSTFQGNSGAAVFNNSGLVQKTGSTGASPLGVAGTSFIGEFHNNGATAVVNANSGTLSFNAPPGSTSTYDAASRLNIAAGATLQFGGGSHTVNAAVGNAGVAGNVAIASDGTVTVGAAYNATGTFSMGAGTAHLNATDSMTLSTITVSGGTANFNPAGTVSTGTIALSGGVANFNVATSAPVLNLSGSGVLGGTGTVTLSGAGTWTGNAAMGGSGRTVLQSGASLALSDGSTKFLSGGRVIDNAGTFTLSGNHALRIDTGGATFNNSGTFTFTDNSTFQGNSGAAVFNNSGLVQKTGSTGASPLGVAGTSFIGEFHNNGATAVVNANSGTLSFNAPPGSTSTYDAASRLNIAAGATLQFGGGSHTVNAAVGNAGVAGNVAIASDGTVTVGAAYNATGTFSMGAGTAHLNATDSMTLSTITVSGGTANFNPAGTVSTGTIALSGGVANFNVATSAPVLNLSGSGVLGGTGTVTLSGAGTWTGNAAMGGSGRTVLQSGASLALSDGSTKFLSGGRVIDNAGTFTLSGNHALRIDTGGATFNNSGTFTFTDNSTFQGNSGAAVFNNSGLVQKTGSTGASPLGVAGTSFIGEFHNNGATAVVNANSGTLSFNAPPGSTSTYDAASRLNIAAGATLQFGGGSHTVNAAVGNAGVAGNVAIASDGTVTVGAAYNATGTFSMGAGTAHLNATDSMTLSTITVSGGTANFNPAGTVSTGTIALSGGVANFNVATSAPVLNLSGSGVLGGTGTVTLSGAGTWTGNAAMGGSGRTVLQSGASLALSDGSTKFLSGGRVIDNAGTFTLSGNHALRIDTGGATFNNSGTFTFTDNSTFQGNSGAAVFNNSGLVQKTGSTGASPLGVAGTSFIGEFHNNGATAVVNANSGTLSFTDTLTNSGLINVGATLQKTVGFTNAGSGVIRGGGTIDVGAGTLTNSGTINAGTSPGTLSITGNLTMTPSSVTNIEIQAPGTTAGTDYDLIAVTGTVTFDGTLNVTHLGGFTPGGGQQLQIITYAARAGTTDFAAFNPQAATYSRTFNPTNLTLNAGAAALNEWISDNNLNNLWSDGNNWSLGIPQPGHLVLLDRAGFTGTVLVNTGAQVGSQIFSTENILVSGGTLTLSNTGTINATLGVSGGTLSNGGSLTVQTLNLSGGTLAGTGTVTVTGVTTFNGGQMTGTGRTIAQGGLSIGGPVGLDAGRVLENRGTASWSAGSIDLNAGVTGGSGRIENALGALFEASGDHTLTATGFADRNTVAGFPAFVNAGTLRKAGGTGITAIDVPLNNTGTVQVQSGTLAATEFLTNAGTINIASGATLSTNGNHLTNAAGGVIGGSGTLVLGAATLTNQGTVRPGGLNSAGTLHLTGHLNNDGVLEFELGGNDPGGPYDVIAATGGVNLNFAGSGTIRANDLAGYAAVAGHTYSIITAGGGVTGTPTFVSDTGGTYFGAGSPTYVLTALSGGALLVNNWNTDSNGFWNDPNNWTLASDSSIHRVPTVGDRAVIDRPGSPVVTFDTTSRQVGQLQNAETLTVAGNTLELLGPSSSTGVINISGGTLTATGNLTASTLNISVGTLTGTGSVTVSSALNWSGGTMTGSGTTTVASAGTLTLNGTGNMTLRQRTFTSDSLNGAWNGNGTIQIGEGAVFTNAGTLTATGDGTVTNDLNTIGGSAFVNSGVFIKNGGAGVTTFTRNGPLTFNNSGTLEVQSGTVAISGDAFNNTGLVSLAGNRTLNLATGGAGAGLYALGAGAQVNFTGGTQTFNSGADIGGSGVFTVNGGVMTVSAADMHADRLALTSGTINGTGALTVDDGFTWSGGVQSGAGTTTVASAGTLTLNGAGTMTLDTRAFTSNSTSGAWNGDGTINIGQGAQFINAGTLTATGDGTVTNNINTAGGSAFVNSGAFVKNGGAGVTTFTRNGPLTFNNSGTLEVQSGTVAISGDAFNNTGLVSLAGNRTLNLATGGAGAGLYALGAGAQVNFTSGAQTFTTGADINGEGLFNVTGGTMTVTAATMHADTLRLASGTIDGTGALVVDNDFTWSGGTQSGPGSTTVASAGALTLNGAGTMTLDTRAFTSNSLNGAWNGDGTINIGQGAQFINAGTLTATGDGTVTNNINTVGGSAFVNSGVFIKNGGAGVTTFTQNGPLTLNNSGALDVQSGAVTISTTSFTTPGTISVKGTGAANTLTVSGNLSLAGSSVINTELAGTGVGQFGKIHVTGSAALNGTLNVTHAGGFTPTGSQTFNVMTYTSATGDFVTKKIDGVNFPGAFGYTGSPSGAFYRLASGGGVVTNSWNTDSDGEWNDPTKWLLNHVPTDMEVALIDRGAANPVVTYSNTGTQPTVGQFQNAEMLRFTGGTLTLAGNSSSTGILEVAGGTLAIGGTTPGVNLTAHTLNLSRGTVSGTGSLNVTDAYTHTGGTVNIGGAVAITQASGNLGLGAITANGITARAVAGNLSLNGALSSAANITLATSGNFVNNSGVSALAAAGRWLVWSQNPANDTRGGIVYDFKQYNANFDTSAVQGSGNGFLYTLAPTITPSLTGTVTRVYDGTTAATLAPANYTVSGAVDGDIVTLNNPTTGSYDSANFGTGKNVTASGVAIASATNGAATVFGYQLANTSATGNIGTIDKANLTVSTNDVTKTYDGTTTAPGAAAVVTSGTLYINASSGNTQDGLTGGTFAFTDRNAGIGSKTVSVTGVAVNDGNGGNNYNLTLANNTTSTINKAALTLSAVTDTRTYDGTTTSAATPTTPGLVAGDTVGSLSQSFNSKNVLGTNGSTLAVNGGFAVNDGNSGGNYNVVTSTANGTITPKALGATGVLASDKAYDGNTAATLNVSGATLTGVVAGDTVSLSTAASTAAFADRHVGTGKTVTVNGLALGGPDATNYTVNPGGSLSASITQLASVIWVGGASGNWSVASNWAGGALPDRDNVAQVVIPAGSTVIYDLASAASGKTTLNTLSSSGTLQIGTPQITTGELEVVTGLSTAGYKQVAGAVSGSGSFTATDSFELTGGTLSMGGTVGITQATGNLVVGAPLTGSTITLNATAGNIAFSGAGALATTVGGATLSAGGSITSSPGGGTQIDTSAANGPITLSAAAIGAAGSGRIGINPGTGMVSATAASSGIYLEQTAGDLATSQYRLSATGTAQNISLATTNGAIDVDTIGGFAGNTANDVFSLATAGAAKDIAFSDGISLTAAGLGLAGTGNATFNAGAVTLNTSVSASLPITIGGATVNLNGATPSSTGTLNLVSGTLMGTGGLTVNGAWNYTAGNIDTALVLASGSNSMLTNVTVPGTGTITNHGLLGLDNATVLPPLTNQGTLTTAANSVNAINASANPGTIALGDLSVLMVPGALDNTGMIKGNGTLKLGNDGTQTLTNNGSVAPGASPGTLVIQGNYVQTASGNLEIEVEVDSVTASKLFDVLDVTGTVSLAGNLFVKLLNGSRPASGDSVKIMQYKPGTTAQDFINAVAPAGYTLNRAQNQDGSYTITFISTDAAAAAASAPPPPTAAAVQEVIEVTTNPLVTATASLGVLAGPGAPGGSDTSLAGGAGDPFFSSGESSATGFVGTSATVQGSASGEGEQKQGPAATTPAKPKKPPLCR